LKGFLYAKDNPVPFPKDRKRPIERKDLVFS
jgi:hypothetical protein